MVFIIIAFTVSARPGGKIQRKNDDMQQDLRKYIVYIIFSNHVVIIGLNQCMSQYSPLIIIFLLSMRTS